MKWNPVNLARPICVLYLCVCGMCVIRVLDGDDDDGGGENS